MSSQDLELESRALLQLGGLLMHQTPETHPLSFPSLGTEWGTCLKGLGRGSHALLEASIETQWQRIKRRS